MNTFISLLRGINVSGQNRILMSELVQLYESLGLVRVETYLQSGNVIFDSPEQDENALTASISASIQQILGLSVNVLVRSPAYFQVILENNPFLTQHSEDPTRLHVTFLQQAPSEEQWNLLKLPANETGQWIAAERAIYLFCPDGYGKTKLSNTFFEKKLGGSATTRNWNTVQVLNKIVKSRID